MSPRRLSPRWRYLAACLGLALAWGCAGAPLANTEASARAIAERVLDALARDDRPALEALALDEAEFRRHVWPGLPAARRERNLPFSYVWGDLHQKSQTSLSRILAAYRGRRFELRDVRFEAAPTRYAGFVVHREAVLVVRAPSGEEEIRVCGSLVEKDGRWKVFSYVVDD